MKSLIKLSTILIMFIHGIGYAQLMDENSLVIEKYFSKTTPKESKDFESLSSKSFGNSSINNSVRIAQNGTNNSVYINVEEQRQNIVQIGNQNNFEFVNFYEIDLNNFVVFQQGINNNIRVFGENQLLQNMSIIQRSNFQTIEIHNFKN